MAYLHKAEPEHKFPVGFHVSLKSRTDVAMDARVFKWQAAQVISSMSNSKSSTEIDEKELKLKRAKSMESLLTCARSESKRLRLVKTDDGNTF